MADIVGALTARLGWDNSGFDRGQAAAQDSLRGFQSHVGKVGVAFAAAGALATGFRIKSANTFKTVGREALGLTRITGSTIEKMSVLRYAADRVGIGVDNLSTGIRTLGKHLVANDGAIDRLGISTRDAAGKLLPFDTVLAAILDKFQSMPDGIEKTALATALFGKNGASLLPLLNRGSSGLAEMAARARELGLVLDDHAASKIRASVEADRRWKESLQGLEVQLGQRTLPAITRFKTAGADALSWLVTKPGFGEAAASVMVLTSALGATAPVISAVADSTGLLQSISKTRLGTTIAQTAANYRLAASETAVGRAIGFGGGLLRVAAGAALTTGLAGFALQRFSDPLVGYDPQKEADRIAEFRAMQKKFTRRPDGLYTNPAGTVLDRTSSNIIGGGSLSGIQPATRGPGFTVNDEQIKRQLPLLRSLLGATNAETAGVDRLATANKRAALSFEALGKSLERSYTAHVARTTALRREYNMFDEVQRKATGPDRLVTNMRDQLRYRADTVDAFTQLNQAGVTAGALAQLKLIEDSAPGTARALVKKLTPALAAEINSNTDLLLQTAQSMDYMLTYQAAAAGKHAGELAADGFIGGFYGRFGIAPPPAGLPSWSGIPQAIVDVPAYERNPGSSGGTPKTKPQPTPPTTGPRPMSMPVELSRESMDYMADRVAAATLRGGGSLAYDMGRAA